MIETGGGAFRRDGERPLYFLAGSPCWGRVAVERHARNVLMAVDVLMSDGAEDGFRATLDLPGRNVLMDSGVFNLVNTHARANGLTMDEALTVPAKRINGYDRLYRRYVDLAQRYGDQLWGYVELDFGGRDEKRAARRRLEGLGLRPIPVYHPLLDGVEYFDELAENYDRIALGNISLASASVRKRIVATVWERKQRYPHLWVHLLGMNVSPLMLAMPCESADASTWLASVRWPAWKCRALQAGFSEMGSRYQYLRAADESEAVARSVAGESSGPADDETEANLSPGVILSVELAGLEVQQSQRCLHDFLERLEG